MPVFTCLTALLSLWRQQCKGERPAEAGSDDFPAAQGLRADACADAVGLLLLVGHMHAKKENVVVEYAVGDAVIPSTGRNRHPMAVSEDEDGGRIVGLLRS